MTSRSGERALQAGLAADRLAFAFAPAYQEALRALVPGDGVRSLCVTEARGNGPKDIDTVLEGDTVTGMKKWATGGPLATELLVCAKAGVDDRGRNQLKLVRVAAADAKLVPSSIPFIPEVPHAEVILEHVRVREVLPGDGYADYVKPFRTVEDAHVHCALVGYLTAVARRHGFAHDLIERLIAIGIACCGIAALDPKAPDTHVALAGAMTIALGLVAEIERAWEQVPDEEWTRWQRDRPLLRVASAARAARRERAWDELSR